ncbi:DUF2179 domain-containing protein [Elusimicrobiota bacterium]
MDHSALIDQIFAGSWGPVVIFLLRIIDVSMGTVRTMLTMRNAKTIVPVIAFFEVLIWIFAVGNAIKNLNSPWHLIGYAGGFAAGNVVGMWIEGKLAYGFVTAHIISKTGKQAIAQGLRERGYGVTEFRGRGWGGRVQILLSVIKRRDVRELIRVAKGIDPKVFVTIEEAQHVRQGWILGKKK